MNTAKEEIINRFADFEDEGKQRSNQNMNAAEDGNIVIKTLIEGWEEVKKEIIKIAPPSKEEFEAIASKYNVQIRGIHGEHTETDDGIFDISNKRRLGQHQNKKSLPKNISPVHKDFEKKL